MLRASRGLLLILNTGNWLFFSGALIVLALLASGAGPLADHVTRGAYPGYQRALLHAVELLVVIGLVVVFPVDIIFRRLLAILASVEVQNPFRLENAARLRHIAWALLAIQLLDLGFGALTLHIAAIARKPIPWSFGLTGWLAVLLLFILARVFRHGAEMRDDIEATI